MPVRKKHELICAKVIQLLREERERQKLTIYAISKKTGLSHQAVTLIEREQRIPSLETVIRISISLNVDLGDVIQRAFRTSTASK